VRVEDARPGTRLRVGGWPVAGPDPAASDAAGSDAPTRDAGPDAAPVARTGCLTSALTVALGEPVAAGVQHRTGASPLGDPARVPWVTLHARPGTWVAVLVTLDGTSDPTTTAPTATVAVAETAEGVVVRATWPDGAATRTVLPVAAPADPARSTPQ
jgi:hypothetical protein